MADLPSPLRVSALIRFARWSFLTAGIAWGALRYSYLSKKESALREIEKKQKAIRDAKLAEEKKRLAKEELDNLARQAGATPEP